MPRKKKTMGRRKIEIKKIEKPEARQVCFSKRKGSLMKKAHELSVLFGAEVGIITFSPAGKPFSYGHPDIHSVIRRYNAWTDGVPEASVSDPSSKAETLSELQRKEEELGSLVTAEKRKRRMMMDAKTKYREAGEPFWWDADIEGLNLEELQQFMAALEGLQMNVVSRAEQIALQGETEAAQSMTGAGNGGVGPVVADGGAGGYACGFPHGGFRSPN